MSEQEQPLHDLHDIEAKLRAAYFGPVSRPYMKRMCREIRRLQGENDRLLAGKGIWRARAEGLEAERDQLKARVAELESLFWATRKRVGAAQ